MRIIDKFLSFFKDKSSAPPASPVASPINAPPTLEVAPVALGNDYQRLGLLKSVTTEEKELVSVITTATMVGDSPDSQFRVKEVYAIDTDKEVAMIIAAAVATRDSPNSSFKLKSITEIV